MYSALKCDRLTYKKDVLIFQTMAKIEEAKKKKTKTKKTKAKKKVTKKKKKVRKKPGVKPKMFAKDPKDLITAMGAQDELTHQAEVLRSEWVMLSDGEDLPFTFLTQIKGYSHNQARSIIRNSGGVSEWKSQKAKFSEKITTKMAEAHVDKMVEVQDTHIAASKLGLAKAIELMTKMKIEPARSSKGKIIRDGKGNPVQKGFRSIELLNCMSVIEKSQNVYRKAMGLSNDEGGLAQILEVVRLNKIGAPQVNVQNNIQINEAEQKSVNPVLEKLDYDQVMVLIEARRKADKKEKREEARELKDVNEVEDVR